MNTISCNKSYISRLPLLDKAVNKGKMVEPNKFDTNNIKKVYIEYSRIGKIIGVFSGIALSGLIIVAIAVILLSNTVYHYGVASLLKHITVYNPLVWGLSVILISLVSSAIGCCVYIKHHQSAEKTVIGTHFLRAGLIKVFNRVLFGTLFVILGIFIIFHLTHFHTNSFIQDMIVSIYRQPLIYIAVSMIFLIPFGIIEYLYIHQDKKPFCADVFKLMLQDMIIHKVFTNLQLSINTDIMNDIVFSIMNKVDNVCKHVLLEQCNADCTMTKYNQGKHSSFAVKTVFKAVMSVLEELHDDFLYCLESWIVGNRINHSQYYRKEFNEFKELLSITKESMIDNTTHINVAFNNLVSLLENIKNMLGAYKSNHPKHKNVIDNYMIFGLKQYF